MRTIKLLGPIGLMFVAGFFWLNDGKISAGGLAGLLIASTVVGLLLSNADRIAELVIDLGKAGKYAIKMKEGAEKIERIAQEIQALARPLVDCLYLYVGTSNLHPPGRTVEQAVENHVLRLAELACPDPNERQAWIQGLDAQVENAQRNWPDWR